MSNAPTRIMLQLQQFRHVDVSVVSNWTYNCVRRNVRKTFSNFAAPMGAMALVWSWLIASSLMPAAILVIVEIAAAFSQRNRARITTGTVDMPTASAPSMAMALISAGVSKDGPEYQA